VLGRPATPQLFLNVDNGFGARKAPRETGIVPLRKSQLGGKRVGLGGLRTAFARNQRTERTGITQPAPVAQG
jgi:hypothetical protein